MSAIPEDWLAAAESLMDEELNSGVSAEAPQTAVEPAEAPEGDTPELKIDATGRAHDATTGKFVSTKEDEPQEDSAEEEVPADVGIEPEAETEEEVAQEIEELVYEIDDPDLLDYLSKYDGDVVKALKAAREAQSLIGRQGSELGELRQELRQLAENLQRPQQPVYVGPYQNDIDENPEGLVYEALERGDAQTVQQALEAWGEVEPFKAASFLAALPQMLHSLQQEEPQYQQEQPTTSLESEFAAFKERHPDIERHLPGIQKVLTERPHLHAAVASGDPRARAQAFEDAYLLARSQSTEADTSVAARKIVLRAKAEADKAKADAAVVRASKTSSAEVRGNPNEKLQETLRTLSGLDDLEIV